MFHVKHDVIVIGGGHAGTEAAHASARMGASTLLITMKSTDIGVMSCNPAIGGLGKGHLVREIDALDGVMARVADRAGIQFRLLNRRKGPAVQGPRAQADRKLFQSAMQDVTANQQNLRVLFAEVVDVIESDGRVNGVVLSDGAELYARSVILTSGTFLNGIIHIGAKQTSGGRIGDRASTQLAQRLYGLDLNMGRLKTGTPPRLDGRTIDWERLDRQDGDDEPTVFSFLNTQPVAPQISCGITHTNPQTHDIIRANLSRSAMYGGHIDGVGPRYCPSIEDKITRFSEKESHQIFLEPEGLTDNTVYPNGISTSLPVEIQEQYVHSIVGLENCSIIQPGYAIEYDFVDPRGLNERLELPNLRGLYLAGQINGTTGYEEAAAQGLVAGLNAAAASLGKDPIIFDRSSSYIGVMIDDLTLKGVSEPYRMFTSRAEFRLSLRADNADQRLTEFGYLHGCVGENRWQIYQKKMDRLTQAKQVLSDTIVSSRDLNQAGVKINIDGPKRSLLSALSISGTKINDLEGFLPNDFAPSHEISVQIERDALYEHYVNRQKNDIELLRKDQDQVIPASFDYNAVAGLSNELTAKLNMVRPSNVGQASRIDGMTPAALLLLSSHLRKGPQQRNHG